MQDLSPATRVIRSSGLVSTDMDGDTIMMSIEGGKYFGLGGVGPRVWELLDKEISLAEAIQVISDEYDVDASECQRDLLGFVGELVKSDLVMIC